MLIEWGAKHAITTIVIAIAWMSKHKGTRSRMFHWFRPVVDSTILVAGISIVDEEGEPPMLSAEWKGAERSFGYTRLVKEVVASIKDAEASRMAQIHFRTCRIMALANSSEKLTAGPLMEY